MVINNFDLVRKFIESLQEPEDFIWVQIIQRKKDFNILPSYTSNARVIKSFQFFDTVVLEKETPRIINFCEQNNARAYFWVNPRNTKKVACKAIAELSTLISENNTKQCMRILDKACGLTISPNYKHTWVVDIDCKDPKLIDKYKEIINECRGALDGNKVFHIVPTINGVHLLTCRFDLHQFYQKLIIANLDKVDVHKDSPSLLYYKPLN